MNKIPAILILLVLFGCKSSNEKTTEPFGDLKQSIDRHAKNVLSHGNVNSISIAVYKDGNTYHNYYGEIDSGANNLPNDSTLFEIASISKVFVGSLTARAVVNGKLSLDSDIREFLPGDYPNLEYEGKPVTIQNLVTHTLGFETPEKLNEVYKRIFAGEYKANPIKYNISDLFVELETVELKHEPGTFYKYNNVGPDLAAYILEQVYRKPYSELLGDFLEEIGMTDTYLQEFEKHEDRIINGYTESGTLATVDENPLLGGASGIITTLPDLAKFMQYQLESGKPYIKESTQSLFQNEEENMGYLWDVGYAEVEGTYYLKTGTSNGVQSILLVCPDSDYGQILIMNNTSESATNDWLSLYNRIEYDLIKYPKINLWSKVEPMFLKEPNKAKQWYIELKKDTVQYFAESNYLNRIGYDFLYHDKEETAIEVFKLAIATDPNNANLYDSLGEAYFKVKDYERAKESYSTSLQLDSTNANAENYIREINQLLEKTDESN